MSKHRIPMRQLDRGADQGYAAAIGMFLLIVTLVFTAVQWRISRTRDLVD